MTPDERNTEIRNSRANLAAKLRPLVSEDYILRRIFQLSDEQIEAVKASRSQ